MRKFQQNTLWRDKNLDRLKAHGSIIHTQPLTDLEYDHQLRLKMTEECKEVCAAKTTQELIAELADVYEVIDTLCALHTISKETLAEAQETKRATSGGFYNRTYVTSAEHPINSYGEQYCLAQPEKYPEIF